MINFIRSLQMIIHLPMLMIIIPSNMSAFFSKLIPIVTFDILDSDWTTALVFEFDEDMHEKLEPSIFDQMETLGYETNNSLMNLGSLAIFSLLYYVRLFILLFVWMLSRIPFFKRYFDKLYKDLIFTEILAISTEGYFEFLISGIMNVSNPLTTTDGEIVSLGYGYYSCFLSLGLVPISLFYVFWHKMEMFSDEKFAQKWRALYEEFRQNNKY